MSTEDTEYKWLLETISTPDTEPECLWETIFSSLPDELVSNEIISQLGPADLISLKNSCKELFFRITPELCVPGLSDKVHRRLESLFGDQLDVLYSFLSSTKSAITGSFLISTILDDEYGNSDLDIVAPHSATLEDSVKALGKTLGLHDITSNDSNEDYDTLGDNSTAFSRRVFWLPRVKLDVITTSSPTAEAHIATFDFSITKNVYRVTDGGRKRHLTIADLPSILNRVLRVDKITPALPARIHKYVYRDFRIGAEHVNNTTDVYLFERLMTEVVKSNTIELQLVNTSSYSFKPGTAQVIECIPNRCPCRFLRHRRAHCHIRTTDPNDDYYPFAYSHTLERSILVVDERPTFLRK